MGVHLWVCVQMQESGLISLNARIWAYVHAFECVYVRECECVGMLNCVRETVIENSTCAVTQESLSRSK
jgi:hypothetical protein